MPKILEKVERRLGEKLFLKADRCFGPKCALIRRAVPPGVHGKGQGRRGRRGGSEYDKMLRAKQKVRYLYGLDDKDVARYTKKAVSMAGVFSSNFLMMLEARLDNVVFRSGLAPSRRTARQIVSHGHIAVNDRIINIPSFQVKKGDRISIKEKSLRSPLFSGIEVRLKNYEPPSWLVLDKNKKEAVIGDTPLPPEDRETLFEVTKIKEFYSR